MIGDVITYHLPAPGITGQGKEHKTSGPFVASVLAGHYRDVTDEEVREYVTKMHRGMTEVIIERKPNGIHTGS